MARIAGVNIPTQKRVPIALQYIAGIGSHVANQIVEAAKGEAIAEATRQKELAQAEIDAAANRAREELRAQVSTLAVAGAEKLLRKEIDANAHKALLDELAAEI